MQDIAYTDPQLYYAGRWIDYEGSKGSGWQGAQIRFKVSGTTTVSVNCLILDTTTSDVVSVIANFDGGAQQIITLSSTAASTSGPATATFTLPDNGEHTVILKLACLPTSQWTNASYCRLTSIGIDNGGVLSAWGDSAPRRLAVVGDSWMATQHDWPFLMGIDNYSIWPVSFGGAKASDLNNQYDYDRSGVVNTYEPTFDAIIINSSVNDYLQGVSTSAFRASLLALGNKIRAKHPETKLVFLQSPRNVPAAKLYDQYGPDIQYVAGQISNSVYLESTPAEWEQLTWNGSDTAHLSFAGRQVFAAINKAKIDALFATESQQSIFVKTQSGTLTIPLYSAVPSDALTAPLIKRDGQLYKMAPTPVPAATYDAVLIRLPEGIRKLSRP